MHLLGQPGQVRQLRTPAGSGSQDRIGVVTAVFGQLLTPAADRLRPRGRDLPGG